MSFKPALILLLIFSSLFTIHAKAEFREIYHGANMDDDIVGTSFLNASTGFVAFTHSVGFTQGSGHTYYCPWSYPGQCKF